MLIHTSSSPHRSRFGVFEGEQRQAWQVWRHNNPASHAEYHIHHLLQRRHWHVAGDCLKALDAVRGGERRVRAGCDRFKVLEEVCGGEGEERTVTTYKPRRMCGQGSIGVLVGGASNRSYKASLSPRLCACRNPMPIMFPPHAHHVPTTCPSRDPRMPVTCPSHAHHLRIPHQVGPDDVLAWARALAGGSDLRVHMLAYGNLDRADAVGEGRGSVVVWGGGAVNAEWLADKPPILPAPAVTWTWPRQSVRGGGHAVRQYGAGQSVIKGPQVRSLFPVLCAATQGVSVRGRLGTLCAFGGDGCRYPAARLSHNCPSPR